MNKVMIVVAVALLAAIGCVADTIVLQSGASIEGEIVSENNTAVQMRVPNVSRTIFSLQEFSRGDIKEIRRGSDPATGMQEALQNVQRYQLTTYSYAPSYYDNVISNVFLKFLSGYPQSPQASVVQDTLRTWNAERDEVAKGGIKWKNQWYHGDEARRMAAVIQVAQVIEEGDRQLQAGKFESAIGQYTNALQRKPLLEENLTQIEMKCANALAKWSDSVAAATKDPGAAIAARQQAVEQLQAEIKRCRQEIARIETEKAGIAGARLEDCPLHGGRHWMAGGKCLGATLPDTKTTAINNDVIRLRNAILRAEEEIAKQNTAVTALQSGVNADVETLEKIKGLRAALDTKITGARAELTGGATLAPARAPAVAGRGEKTGASNLLLEAERQADQGHYWQAIEQAKRVFTLSGARLDDLRRAQSLQESAYNAWLNTLAGKMDELKTTVETLEEKRHALDSKLLALETQLNTEKQSNTGYRTAGLDSQIGMTRLELAKLSPELEEAQKTMQTLQVEERGVQRARSQTQIEAENCINAMEEKEHPPKTWWEANWKYVIGGTCLLLLIYAIMRVDAWRNS